MFVPDTPGFPVACCLQHGLSVRLARSARAGCSCSSTRLIKEVLSAVLGNSYISAAFSVSCSYLKRFCDSMLLLLA